MKRIGTVALIVERKADSTSLVDAISDDQEIEILESRLNQGDSDPLRFIYDSREQHTKEDEEFGDYVEQLLCHPFLKEEIREQGLQWFRSKIKIEQYQRSEREATRVIAGYAFKIYESDPTRKDFLLASNQARVRIRIFEFSALARSAA